MSENNEKQTEHAWFREQMPAYLAGALDGQRERFEAHAAQCKECAAELEQLKREDQAMTAVFAANIPGAEFEDRIIASLRHRWTERLVIHPAVRKAAVGVAAMLILGTAGYTANTLMNRGGLPSIFTRDESGKLALTATNDERVRSASNLRQIGQASELYDVSVSGAASDEKLGVRVLDSLRRRVGSESAGDRESHARMAEEKKIPYEDIYRYPANWPDVSNATGGRIAGVAGQSAVTAGDSYITHGLANPTVGGGGGTGSDKPSSSIAPFKPTEWGMMATNGSTLLLGGQQLGYFTTPKSSAEKEKAAPTGIGAVAGDVDGNGIADGARRGSQIAAAGPAPATPSNAPEQLARPQAGRQAQTPQTTPPVSQTADITLGRKIIRTGQMEFEVDSFDIAFAQVSKIVTEEAGFVASTESQKLPNGKMTGSITVRVTPEHLDTLVMKLRALGELKNQRIAAQDITKQYTDLESQLRAARAMEGRLLEIIKTGQGQIKDLVAAEKELGVWREKIEHVEGEIRFYNNQVSLSTLTITLSERDVKSAAYASETEIRNLGIETEDVEKAYTAAQELVGEFKGRIVSAVLKKLEAQQMAASITCEVAPENAGPMTDRLKQLGNVARLESDRKTTTTDGTEPQLTSKLQRKDTRFVISLYNLANIAPRQTTNLNIASRNVEQTYAAILERVNKAAGRVVNSNLNQLKADQTGATINFQVKTADADALLNDIRTNIGEVEVLRLTSTENPDTANVSAAKRGFAIQIISLAAVAPRETINLQLAVPTVAEAHQALSDLLGSEKVQARVLSGQLSKRDGQSVSGSLDFEIRRSDLPAFESALSAAGDVFGRNSTRSNESENTTDSKVRVTMGIINASDLPPRETFSMDVEAGNVEKVLGDISAAAAAAGGQSADSRLTHEPSGRVMGHVMIDVPQAKGPEIIKTIQDRGTVKAIDTQKNSQIPEGKLARARLDVTISNGEGLVAGDKGVWASIRNALGTSVAGLLWSLQLIVIGVFLVGPWAIALWVALKLLRRMRRPVSVKAA